MQDIKTNPIIFPFLLQGVAEALWSLVREGSVGVVVYRGANYFVPTPGLANIVLADLRNLRVV